MLQEDQCFEYETPVRSRSTSVTEFDMVTPTPLRSGDNECKVKVKQIQIHFVTFMVTNLL